MFNCRHKHRKPSTKTQNQFVHWGSPKIRQQMGECSSHTRQIRFSYWQWHHSSMSGVTAVLITFIFHSFSLCLQTFLCWFMVLLRFSFDASLISVDIQFLDVSIQLINYKKALKSIDLSIGGEDIQAQWEDFEANVRKVTFSAARYSTENNVSCNDSAYTITTLQNGASSTVPRFAHSFQEDLPPQAGYCGHQVWIDIGSTPWKLAMFPVHSEPSIPLSMLHPTDWQKTYDKTQVTVGFQSGASQLVGGQSSTVVCWCLPTMSRLQGLVTTIPQQEPTLPGYYQRHRRFFVFVLGKLQSQCLSSIALIDLFFRFRILVIGKVWTQSSRQFCESLLHISYWILRQALENLPWSTNPLE